MPDIQTRTVRYIFYIHPNRIPRVKITGHAHRGRKVKLRAGAVSSLRAVMRGVASRFLACHNRGLSLARSGERANGRTDGWPAGSWLRASELFIPLDYAPRAAPKRPAETNKLPAMKRASERATVASSFSSSSSPVGVSVHADLALLMIDADAAVGVCTYALGRYRRRQERDNEDDDNLRPTRVTLRKVDAYLSVSVSRSLSLSATMVEYCYSDAEFRAVLGSPSFNTAENLNRAYRCERAVHCCRSIKLIRVFIAFSSISRLFYEP